MAFEWLVALFGQDGKRNNEALIWDNALECATAAFDDAYRSVVTLVSGMVAAREFRTFRDFKEHRGREWYRWNHAISTNLTPAGFWYRVFDNLFTRGEEIIVEIGNRLYPADSWASSDDVIDDRVYTQVQIGELSSNKVFHERDVIHLFNSGGYLTGPDGPRISLDQIRDTYVKIVKSAISGYTKSRGIKGTLELDTPQAGTKTFQDNLTEIKNGEFRKFAEADNSVLPLYKGMKFNNLGEKSYAAETTRDIRNLIDDACDIVGRAYGVPPQLINGSNTDVEPALNFFLTSRFVPLCEQLSAEISRKRYGENAVMKGNFLRVDTRQIKHVELVEEGSHISSLVGSGIVSVNDIERMIRELPIGEKWADSHYITLNNASAGSFVNGGEKQSE